MSDADFDAAMDIAQQAVTAMIAGDRDLARTSLEQCTEHTPRTVVLLPLVLADLAAFIHSSWAKTYAKDAVATWRGLATVIEQARVDLDNETHN